jgi:hypothetical protein
VSLAFLLPAGLAALAALLLPLLIHLARRSEQRPTVFAALQWLRQKPKPRHRIRFDEWLLLVLRLLLLVVMALLLAQPVLFGAASEDPWVAVVPGVDAAQAKAMNAPEHARWHWLSPGFPELSEKAVASNASVTSLLRELDASLPPGVSLTVIVPKTLDGVDGQVPRLSRRVDWRISGSDSNFSPTRATSAAVPTLRVRHAPEREASVRYVRATNAAWGGAQDIGSVTQAIPPKARQLVWLAPGPVPQHVIDWIRAGGTVLLDSQATLAGKPTMVALWRDVDGTVLVEGAALGNGRVMRLTKPLTPSAMPNLLDGDFPQHLRTLFEPMPPAPARVLAAAHAPSTGAFAFPPAPRALEPWLLALIVLLFAVERWVATGSRRGAAP